MRRVLVTLVVAAVVVAVAWFLAGLPGTVTAQMGDMTFSAATSVVAVGLLAVFLSVYFCSRRWVC